MKYKDILNKISKKKDTVENSTIMKRAEFCEDLMHLHTSGVLDLRSVVKNEVYEEFRSAYTDRQAAKYHNLSQELTLALAKDLPDNEKNIINQEIEKFDTGSKILFSQASNRMLLQSTIEIEKVLKKNQKEVLSLGFAIEVPISNWQPSEVTASPNRKKLLKNE